MQLSLEHIETAIAEEGIAPGTLADYRLYLSAIFSLRGGEMQRIESKKPGVWLDIRAEKNSDKAADREWDATPDGQRQIELKWILKRIEKLSSAIGTKLRIMEVEARNIV